MYIHLTFGAEKKWSSGLQSREPRADHSTLPQGTHFKTFKSQTLP